MRWWCCATTPTCMRRRSPRPWGSAGARSKPTPPGPEIPSGHCLVPAASLRCHGASDDFQRVAGWRPADVFDSAVHAARGWLAAMTESNDRALEIHELTFDARDPHALAAFWGALLDREIRPG